MAVGCSVVVFATGAEAILSEIGAGTPAIEYRHIPDPADIERVVLPAVRSAQGPAADDTLVPENRRAAS